MNNEKYGMYEYRIKKETHGYIYEIYSSCSDYKFFMGTNVLKESLENFETESEARFAAIGHITLIEDGEG